MTRKYKHQRTLLTTLMQLISNSPLKYKQIQATNKVFKGLFYVVFICLPQKKPSVIVNAAVL